MPGQDIRQEWESAQWSPWLGQAGLWWSRRLIPMVLLGHGFPQNEVLGHKQGRLVAIKAYWSLRSLSVSQGKGQMPFFCGHDERQSLLHNVLAASAILTLWFASRTCSCYHIYAVACTVCVLVHSQTPFWNILISPLKEETQVELPG